VALQALVTQLKTGSIASVHTRGDYRAYIAGEGSDELLQPYVLVFDDFAVDAYYTVSNTVQPLVVEVHYPAGFVNELNDYIESELATLLNRKRLTDKDGNVFQVYLTMYISPMAEPNDDRSITGGNDDGTISRYRRIFIPRRGL